MIRITKDGDRYLLTVTKDSESWHFIAHEWQRQEMIRVIGREAADLESGFDWHDAADANEKIRAEWPDYKLPHQCQCQACRQRRDRDAEVQAMKAAELPRPTPAPVKTNSVFGLFLEWILWGK